MRWIGWAIVGVAIVVAVARLGWHAVRGMDKDLEGY